MVHKELKHECSICPMILAFRKTPHVLSMGTGPLGAVHCLTLGGGIPRPEADPQVRCALDRSLSQSTALGTSEEGVVHGLVSKNHLENRSEVR